MAIKAAATRQRELTKRLSPHKVHTKYGDFGAVEVMSFEAPSGSKTGRKPVSVPPQARHLSHFERVALQKQIMAKGKSRKTFDVSKEEARLG